MTRNRTFNHFDLLWITARPGRALVCCVGASNIIAIWSRAVCPVDCAVLQDVEIMPHDPYYKLAKKTF